MEKYPSLEAVHRIVRFRCFVASVDFDELAEDEEERDRLLLAECKDFLDAALEMSDESLFPPVCYVVEIELLWGGVDGGSSARGT